ncbi:isoleucine--tRNA ligase, partial [Striga asiatica]
ALERHETYLSISAKLIASSMPGIEFVKSDINPSVSEPPLSSFSTLGSTSYIMQFFINHTKPNNQNPTVTRETMNKQTNNFDFLTIAYKFENPVTRVGLFVNLCWNASLRLWAGSVEIMSTEDLTLASKMARIELHVVFPTPPLPPTNTHLSVSCSIMFCTVPSGGSSTGSIDPKCRQPEADCVITAGTSQKKKLYVECADYLMIFFPVGILTSGLLLSLSLVTCLVDRLTTLAGTRTWSLGRRVDGHSLAYEVARWADGHPRGLAYDA